VVPDDHNLDSNNYTLQHYLYNSEKYFTSDTELVFIPGKHHLLTDLVIQNVSNLTLRGTDPNGMNSTIIYCTRPAHVFIRSSDNIIIEYIRINECGVSQEKAPLANLVIYNCSNIVLMNSLFVCHYRQCGLAVVNVVGGSYFTNITSNHLLIAHNMMRMYSRITIENYHHMGHSSFKHRAIEVHFHEHYQVIVVHIFQIKLSVDKAMKILSLNSKGVNVVYIQKMEMTGIETTEI